MRRRKTLNYLLVLVLILVFIHFFFQPFPILMPDSYIETYQFLTASWAIYFLVVNLVIDMAVRAHRRKRDHAVLAVELQYKDSKMSFEKNHPCKEKRMLESLETLVIPAILLTGAVLLWTWIAKQQLQDEAFSTLCIGFFAVWASIFWNINNRFGSQWQFAAAAYNQAMSAPSKDREILYTNVALNLLDVGLHNHETFAEFFHWRISEQNDALHHPDGCSILRLQVQKAYEILRAQRRACREDRKTKEEVSPDVQAIELRVVASKH